MFKRGGDKKGDRGYEEKNKGVGRSVGGAIEGFGPNISNTRDGALLFEEECRELLRELAGLKSQEAALLFKLNEALQEAFYETIRLSGYMAHCKLTNNEIYNKLKEIFNIIYNKYVKKE